MKKYPILILVFFLVLSLSYAVNATVLTFDDLPDIPYPEYSTPPPGREPTELEPVMRIRYYGNYGGLDWGSAYYGDPYEINAFYYSLTGIQNYGYINGLVSGPHMAFSWGGEN